MPSPVPFQHRPDAWIKVWIGLGVFAFFLIIIIPISVASLYFSEYYRAQACTKGQRLDCQPSAFWLLYGWNNASLDLQGTSPTSTDGVLPEAVAEPEATSTEPSTPVQTQTSSTSPTIYKVSLPNAQFDAGCDNGSGCYHVAVGTKVTVDAIVSDAKTVALLLSADGSGLTPKKVSTMTSSKGGNYSGTFTMPPGQSDLTIHATGANKETSDLTIKVFAK